MSDATLARMEHGKYVGVREESRRDGVCTVEKTDPVRRSRATAGLFLNKFSPIPFIASLLLF